MAVKGRSTVSYLLEYSSFVLKSIKSDCQVDKGSHFLLFYKMILNQLAVGGCVLTFLVKSSVEE
jgi:hypothetical protein